MISIKKLYNEELDLFYEQFENLDENNNLCPKKMGEFLEKFSENILVTILALTPTSLQFAGNLYFEDLVTTSSTNSRYPNDYDIKQLQFLFHRSFENEVLNDPVRLHVFWWTNSDVFIAELELARICPPIIELISKDNINGNEYEYFRIHLIDQQRLVIESSSKSKALQFLRICNDLISTQLINISDIVDDAINIKY
ncbi:43449_t:CDS:2 [Gigaspora margarita]|uniref:43449_t:CDS:1 n=1 Tax=Gigaspora margarita TaxID=4874 RepID=A0ABN7UKW8_GIGMA|nr:43449_t:CDS:2 [Gigaspora margarita]